MSTVDDYDEYCHYVAGIVGLGLTRLFHASGLEAFKPDDLSNSMGLFLQVLTSVCMIIACQVHWLNCFYLFIHLFILVFSTEFAVICA